MDASVILTIYKTNFTNLFIVPDLIKNLNNVSIRSTWKKRNKYPRKRRESAS